jgi:hypothetical protein
LSDFGKSHEDPASTTQQRIPGRPGRIIFRGGRRDGKTPPVIRAKSSTANRSIDSGSHDFQNAAQNSSTTRTESLFLRFALLAAPHHADPRDGLGVAGAVRSGRERGRPAAGDRLCGAARYIATVLNGLAVQAASGATEKDTRQVAALAMRTWPE